MPSLQGERWMTKRMDEEAETRIWKGEEVTFDFKVGYSGSEPLVKRTDELARARASGRRTTAPSREMQHGDRSVGKCQSAHGHTRRTGPQRRAGSCVGEGSASGRMVARKDAVSAGGALEGTKGAKSDTSFAASDGALHVCLRVLSGGGSVDAPEGVMRGPRVKTTRGVVHGEGPDDRMTREFKVSRPNAVWMSDERFDHAGAGFRGRL